MDLIKKVVSFFALALLLIIMAPVLILAAIKVKSATWTNGGSGLIPEPNWKGWCFIILFYVVLTSLAYSIYIFLAY